jgi:hypothetical protein
VSGTTSLLVIPCCAMNLASLSDAEDSNALEITCLAELISELSHCQLAIADCGFFATEKFDQPRHAKLKIGNRQSEIVNGRRIVSQRHDKVFSPKLAGKRLLRPLFAVD